MSRAGNFVALAALLILGACSDDDAASSIPASSSSASRPTSDHTPTTETPATSVDTAPTTTAPTTTSSSSTTVEPDLLPVLQGLLDRYDEAVASILADPRVAADKSNSAVQSYLSLFAPGSDFAEGALASWVEEGNAGRFYRPGPAGTLVDSTVRELTSATESEAAFTACSVNSMEVVDATGNLIEAEGGVVSVTGVAIRVDGSWVLRDLSLAEGDCPTPGAGA